MTAWPGPASLTSGGEFNACAPVLIPGPDLSLFLVLALFSVPVLVPGLLPVLFPALVLGPGPGCGHCPVAGSPRPSPRPVPVRCSGRGPVLVPGFPVLHLGPACSSGEAAAPASAIWRAWGWIQTTRSSPGFLSTQPTSGGCGTRTFAVVLLFSPTRFAACARRPLGRQEPSLEERVLSRQPDVV